MMPPLSILGACARTWLATTPHRAVEEEYETHWPNKFRKIGRFIKLALTAAAVSTKQAGMARVPPTRTGVFLGTGLNNLADTVPFVKSLYDGESIPSPIQFANSVGNAGAFYLAQAYTLEAPALAICQDEVSFEAAVVNAALLLHAGEIDLALVGGVDAFVPPASEQLCRLGYDASDESIPLGEGVGFWLLSREAGKGIAQLLDATLKTMAPDEALKAHAAKFDVPCTVFLNERLQPRHAELLALLPATSTAAPRPPGIFPTESAWAAGSFVNGPANPGSIYHSLSSTREGLLGAITVRKTL
jgi:hypothetical protein